MEDIKNKKTGIYYGYFIVIACCAMSLTSSITWNTAGVFFQPIMEDLGILRGPLALYLTIVSLTSSLFLPIGGRLMTKYNARVVLPIFVLINGLAIASLSQANSLNHFYIAAVFMGTSQAFFLYLATPTLIARWFITNSGLFTGLCMAFTGIGAIFFNPLAGYIIANFGWRNAYLALGAIILIVVLPLVALFIRNDPKQMGLEPYGHAESTEEERQRMVTGVSLAEAVKSPPFVFLLIFLASIALVTDINAYLPSYAAGLGLGVVIASTIGSASMFGSVTGKVFLGWLNDKNVLGTLVLCGTFGLIGTALMTFVGPGNATILLIGAFLYGLCHSTATVQSPLLVKKIFGMRNFTQIYSVVMMFYSISSGLGQSLWGFIADANNGSYLYSMYGVMALTVSLSIFGCTAYILRKKVSWNYGTEEQTHSSVG